LHGFLQPEVHTMSSIRISGAAPAVLVLAVALSGCATVTRSPSAKWTVSSYPEGAEVTSSNGDHCNATPCSFRVPRKEPFTATVSKAGYEPSTVNVTPTLKPWGAVAFAGNAVVGGLIGIGVDAWTGSMLDPSHNGETITLKPYGGPGSILLGVSSDGCSPDKAAYARQVGVPCEALSERVDFRPAPLQTAAAKPAPAPPTQIAAAQPAETPPTQVAPAQPVETQPLPAAAQPAEAQPAQAAATPPAQSPASQPVAAASPQPTQTPAVKPVQTAAAQSVKTADR
jgi:hypothetical protein